jgi:hypothetical protein
LTRCIEIDLNLKLTIKIIVGIWIDYLVVFLITYLDDQPMFYQKQRHFKQWKHFSFEFISTFVIYWPDLKTINQIFSENKNVLRNLNILLYSLLLNLTKESERFVRDDSKNLVLKCFYNFRKQKLQIIQ